LEQLDGLYLRLSDHVVCCSDAASQRFVPRMARRVVVPNCVDTDQFSPAPDEACT
jgi:hypothetical protein